MTFLFPAERADLIAALKDRNSLMTQNSYDPVEVAALDADEVAAIDAALPPGAPVGDRYPPAYMPALGR